MTVSRSRACALLLALGLSAACRVWGNDVVKVTVAASRPGATQPITELTVVVGSDKYSWDSLPAGATRSFNLLPGPRDDRQLLLSYVHDGGARHWAGPKMDAGAGYEMEIVIDAAGNVTARHCLLPCTLE